MVNSDIVCSLVVVLLQLGLPAAEPSCNLDAWNTPCRKNYSDYMKERMSKADPRGNGCNETAAGDKCPACAIVAAYDKCVKDQTAGCNSSVQENLGAVMFTVKAEWEMVCDPPCEHYDEILKCQEEFQKASEKAQKDSGNKTAVKELMCAALDAVEKCTMKEIDTCKPEQKALILESLHNLGVPKGDEMSQCDEKCNKLTNEWDKCNEAYQKAMKSLTDTEMQACQSGDPKCVACPHMGTFISCGHSAMGECTASIVKGAQQMLEYYESTFASICPGLAHNTTLRV